MDLASDNALSRETSGHSGDSHLARKISAVCIWTIWMIASLSIYLYIRHYARNIPFSDDWWMVPIVTGHETISLKWAWTQHAEHRVLVSKLIYAGLLRWVSPDFRAGMFLNAGLLVTAAAMMTVLVGRLRGRSRLADAVLSLSILTLAQWEILLIGFGLNLVLTSWFSFVLIVVFARSTERPPWMSALAVGLLLVILPLCGGSGLVMLPPLVLWLAVYLYSGWWSGRVPGARVRVIGCLSLLACFTIVVLYLSNYASMRPPVPSMSAMASTSLQFLSLSLCPSPTGHWKAAALIVVTLVPVSLARLLKIAIRVPDERPRAIGLAAVIVTSVLLALAVGVASSGLCSGAGLASRYVPLATPLLSAIYVTWLIYAPSRWGRALSACLLVVACLSLPDSIREARGQGQPRLQCFKQVKRCLNAGMPDSQIIKIACPTLQPNPELAAIWLKMLRSSDFGEFKYRGEPQVAIDANSRPVRR